MKDLTPSDILFIVFFPYILLGYAVLCLLYAPYEEIKKRIASVAVDFRSGKVKG